MALWLLQFRGVITAPAYYPLLVWHSHEMLFGYTAAVIAGFLLTAVRNWTNRATASGLTLMVLAAVWLLGRILPLLGDGVPMALVALIDLAFLPLLAIHLAGPLLRAGQRRNLAFIPLLLVLAGANVAIHLQITGITAHGAQPGLQLAQAVVMLLIALIGGRVIPFFTDRALGSAGRR